MFRFPVGEPVREIFRYAQRFIHVDSTQRKQVAIITHKRFGLKLCIRVFNLLYDFLSKIYEFLLCVTSWLPCTSLTRKKSLPYIVIMNYSSIPAYNKKKKLSTINKIFLQYKTSVAYSAQVEMLSLFEKMWHLTNNIWCKFERFSF